MEQNRVFIAINLDSLLKDQLSLIANQLDSLNIGSNVVWVDSNILHLTLFFFGQIIKQQEIKIGIILEKNLKNQLKFSLNISSIITFPNQNQPRVIGLKVEDKSGELAKIQQNLQKDFFENDFFLEDRFFSPHITLGRVKFIRGKYLFPKQSFNFKFNANSIDVMKSELTSSGPIYQIIKNFKLK